LQKTILFLLLLAACSGPVKQQPAAEPVPVRHDAAFNGAVDSTLTAYYDLSEAFVNWDSVRVQTAAGALQQHIGRLATEVVPRQKDLPAAETTPLLNKVDGGLEQIRNVSGITAQRHAFSEVTKNFFAFLTAAKYNAHNVYFQVCPMAFNDQDSGYWLSKVSDVRNPYLGLHHPTYGKGMIGCGDTQDSLGTNVRK